MIVLENIYYDFNKSYIRSGAARELDELLLMMQQYPSMKIELVSHTDCRGTDKYNQYLSQKRAESAKQYLTARGIASDRIQATGNGETQPRNQCVDGVECSEPEHQYNRRTEVRVTSIDDSINIRYGNNVPKVIDRKRSRKKEISNCIVAKKVDVPKSIHFLNKTFYVSLHRRSYQVLGIFLMKIVFPFSLQDSKCLMGKKFTN